MKTTTAIKNIEKAAEQFNARQFRNVKITKAYRLIIDALENNKTMIRPAHYSGRGRFATALDYTSDVRRILDAAKIKYNAGNDAPRGGKEGNYIILTHING